MRKDEFNRRVDAMAEEIARWRGAWGTRLKWGLGVLALIVAALHLMVHSLAIVLRLDGLIASGAAIAVVLLWTTRKDASAIASARATADIDSALPAEGGTVTFLSEDRLVIGPHGKHYRFDGRVRIASVSYDEDHCLKVQIFDDGTRSRDGDPPRTFNVFLPLPQDWTETRAIWLVKRWTRWMVAGPDAARADFPPLAPTSSSAG